MHSSSMKRLMSSSCLKSSVFHCILPQQDDEWSHVAFDFIQQQQPSWDNYPLLSQRIAQALTSLCPCAHTVIPFGSLVTGVTLKGGDLDYCCLDLQQTSENPFDVPLAMQLNKLRNVFTTLEEAMLQKKKKQPLSKNPLQLKSPLWSFQRIFHARVPLLQFRVQSSLLLPTETTDKPLALDLTATGTGIRNSMLLAEYFVASPELKVLNILVKHWFKRVEMTRQSPPYIHALSSYALSIMVLFFGLRIQNIQPLDEEIVASRAVSWLYDTYATQQTISQTTRQITRDDCKNTALLLREFFKFYTDFAFERDIITLRQHDDSTREQRSSLVVIRDPYEEHNLAKTIDFFKLELLRERFEEALDELEKKKTPETFLMNV